MLNSTYTALIFILISAVTSCTTGSGDHTGSNGEEIRETVVNTEESGESTDISNIQDPQLSDTALQSIKTDTISKIAEAPENEEIVENKASEQKIDPAPVRIGSISFEEPIHDFGRITEGEFIHHTYSFVNKGNAPLVIQKALAACGCTSPEFSKEPILPGESGTVKVVFDSKSRLGRQDKYITIVTNGDPPSQILRMQGTVSTD